jgi:hypothetical protein
VEEGEAEQVENGHFVRKLKRRRGRETHINIEPCRQPRQPWHRGVDVGRDIGARGRAEAGRREAGVVVAVEQGAGDELDEAVL